MPPSLARLSAMLVGSLWLSAGCGDGAGAGSTSASGAGAAAAGGAGATSGAGPGGAGAMGGGAQGGGGAGAQGGGGAGAQGPGPEDTRCGLSFEWLDPSLVGALVVDETPHSTLTVGEAVVAQLLLADEGLPLGRTPDYETLAHRIAYTTQDRGELREATALVVVPETAGAETFPVLLWHHGTTGMNDACSPTFGFEDQGSDAFAIALLLSLFSSYGYIVVAPDYLGQKSIGTPSPDLHPYLIGEPTAIAAWDAVRATVQVLATDDSGAELGSIALWGASQGGHGAMFTALYQPYYAPELDLRVGVYAVPPSNLQAHIAWGTRELRSASGNAALFYTGADAWYDPSPGLSEVFVPPIDTQAPIDLAASCSPDTLDGVTSVDEVFTTGLIAASQGATVDGYPPWSCFVEQASVPTTALPPPTIPGLFILAEQDTLVDPGIEREAFTTLCAQGHALTYLECAGAQHEQGFLFSIDDALDFIDDRLAGVPTPACVETTATTCSNTP